MTLIITLKWNQYVRGIYVAINEYFVLKDDVLESGKMGRM